MQYTCDMSLQPSSTAHHVWTVAAITCVAFTISDMSHEGLGHGVVAYIMGAKHLTLTTTYLNCDIDNKWIIAAGTVVNLIEGVIALALLRLGGFAAHLRFFLWILATVSLFDGTGYFLFSSVFNFGDWAMVIKGIPHAFAVRMAMGAVGLILYTLSMRVVAGEIAVFAERLETVTWVPYAVTVLVNCLAAAFNPLGVMLLLVSALPASAGANAGLFNLAGWARGLRSSEGTLAVTPHRGWMIAGALTAAIFIGVFGHGVTLNR